MVMEWSGTRGISWRAEDEPKCSRLTALSVVRSVVPARACGRRVAGLYGTKRIFEARRVCLYAERQNRPAGVAGARQRRFRAAEL